MEPCHGSDPGSKTVKRLKVPARAFPGPVAQPGRASDFYRKPEVFGPPFGRQSGGREFESQNFWQKVSSGPFIIKQ